MITVFSVQVEASKRMGGGKSIGQQSSNVSNKQATPTSAQTPPPAAPTTQPSRPWGAMLGGLAAGLGLAWLANSLGFGEAFANIIMVMLIGVVAIATISWFMRRRMTNNNNTLAYQSASTISDVNQPSRFQSSNIIGSTPVPTTTWVIPHGFDVVGFELAAKTNFVSLQAAWDCGDITTLSNMMTDNMLKEIQQQLTNRNTTEQLKTDVATLTARLLGIEETETQYLASVEFIGLIRDKNDTIAEPFEEVWNMAKSKITNDGWLLAGIQVK